MSHFLGSGESQKNKPVMNVTMASWGFWGCINCCIGFFPIPWLLEKRGFGGDKNQQNQTNLVFIRSQASKRSNLCNSYQSLSIIPFLAPCMDILIYFLFVGVFLFPQTFEMPRICSTFSSSISSGGSPLNGIHQLHR